ncbi:MAG: aminotransferase class IV [Gemmatimonadota bacterium]|nr:aminotransferase class IV [Gemmatimonadota bacterium]MDH3428110.1 aminotransferase class IV [Gemmatimonadota bacterium]
MSETVFFNGSYVEKSAVRISPDDRGFLFGDGIYEVVRMYGGVAFEIDSHVRRLADGLAAIGIHGNAAILPDVCEQLIERNGLRDGDAIVYVQVTRGVAPRAHHFPDPAVTPTIYAAAWAFAPACDASVGVAVVTAADHRWTRCDIKAVSLLANCLAAEQAAHAGAYETVLVRDGMAIEGTRTSLFGVVNGVVRTAPESNYILPGITRAVAVELCEAEGIAVAQRPMTLDEFAAAEELFLAGTTTEIMPIVKVDNHPVGDGRPGPIATRLARKFAERVAALGG